MTVGLKLLMKTIPQRVIFPFYHAISDDEPLHLKHLYKIKSVESFEKDIDQLLGSMQALTMEEAISAYHVKGTKPGFHLTFDDGLKECSQLIAPMLLRKGVPATFFINSAFIDNHKMFHRHKASVLVERLINDNCTIPNSLLQKYKIGHFSKKQVIDYILRSEFQHSALLDDFAQSIDLSFDLYLKDQSPYMSKTELIWLHENGFTIGSHSHNHPEFYRLSDDEIKQEIDNDIQNLTNLLGFKPHCFAYPFTDHFLENKTIESNIENAGLATFGTAGLKLEKISQHYQRVCLEDGDDKSAASILLKEGIAFHVKRILNRHYTNRLISANKKWIHFFIPRKTRFQLLILKNRVKTPFLLGNRYKCNICGFSYRRMLSHGNHERLNAKCPNCLSLERTRLLWFFLTEEIFPKLNADARVLHFAPEIGIKNKMKKMKSISYTNADIDSLFADSVMDITCIPAEKEEFDLIICSHVLGHVPDESTAISELFRVLKPEGVALIMSLVDNTLETTYENSNVRSPGDKLLHYSENNLVRLHGRDFKTRISKGGFNVEEINYSKALGSDISSRFCLGDGNRETIYVCTKPIIK